MKRIAICQSNYIPWKGYFDLIHDADTFIFYDDVQFTVRDWRNRNKIKTPGGPMWLTIPVGADRNRLICDVNIPDDRWQAKHWETIRRCYGKAPFFGQYEDLFRAVYVDRKWTSLSELNQFLITTIARECLGIRTQFLQSSDFHLASKKQDRIVDLLNAVGAGTYISGPSAKAYLDPERFQKEGIELIWKDYTGYPEYPQLHPPFEHQVTILDLLYHVGPDAPEYIWGWRASRRALAGASAGS